MFADDTRSSSASSSLSRARPKPSPRSAFKSIVWGKLLFLAAFFLPAGHRLRFDDLPILVVVLESAARNFGEQLLAHDDRSQPIGKSILRLHGKPGELCSH